MTHTRVLDRLKSEHVRVCSFKFEPNVSAESREIILGFSCLVVIPVSVRVVRLTLKLGHLDCLYKTNPGVSKATPP